MHGPTTQDSDSPIPPQADWRVELLGASSTFLTLSYIFLLNPVLLAKTGMDLGAAFLATVISASLTTFLMGAWARLPFALAPAPSLTTFFVSYIHITIGLSWQQGMAIVIISGILNILMALLSVRTRLLKSLPEAMGTSITFTLFGFLSATGLSQASLISPCAGRICTGAAFESYETLVSSVSVLLCGFFVSLFLQMPPIKFRGSPILGILAATGLAASFGIRSSTKIAIGWDMLDGIFAADFQGISEPRVLGPLIVMSVIDFFGGTTKYISLLKYVKSYNIDDNDIKISKAMYIDGIGNIVGGLLGASGLAVFVSSAVGVAVGSRTGLTAIFISIFMFFSFALVPFVGTVPAEATSGILLFIGMILIPWASLIDLEQRHGKLNIGNSDLVICAIGFTLALFSFSMELPLSVIFIWYSTRSFSSGGVSSGFFILFVMSILLFCSTIIKSLI